ncbi:sigma-70 family RNA polymerase sigma factor [Sporosarcina cyprini]|uniref:sigma-70 family RNA polymerase sigma factor n=1 Tax=Sporosarcina cyprini TaxID=2910523 RepID=UPI001EDD6205|nr:sigma-70 family RNA polymerase sigma factor [Sporosarcina cyprini]MCG3088524.1 sigma-70 family RNA polymerase sigma factor [Sporosarcina cyprini]
MKITNKNFIKRFKKGKEAAFEYVVDEYIGSVKAVVYNTLGSYHDPELIQECINDTFLGAWDNAAQFNGDAEDFRRWICTIAKFKAIDKQRKQMRMHDPSEITDAHLEPVQSAETAFMGSESTREVLLLLSTLKEIDRDIFIMKYFLDMKNEEIADELGLTKAAVDNRLYRGKKKMQQTQIGGSFA